MARFSCADEQKEFINDSNIFINNLLSEIPVDKQEMIKEIAKNYNSKWIKIFNIQPEKDAMESLKKDWVRIKKLYNQLKKSVNYQQIIPNPSQPGNINAIDECVQQLNFLQIKEDLNKCEGRLIQYRMGEVLSKLKGLTTSKKHFAMVINEINGKGWSISYAYFLIKFYKKCQAYPNLKYTTTSIRIIKNNFSDLLQLIAEDGEFWTKPINV